MWNTRLSQNHLVYCRVYCEESLSFIIHRIRRTDPKIKITCPKIKITCPRIKLTGPRIKLTRPRIKLTCPRIKLTGPKIKLTRARIKLTGPRIKLTRLRRTVHGFTILMISTEQIFRVAHVRGFVRQALYTRRENPWFCVLNRTRTTSKTSMGFNPSVQYYEFHCINSRGRHVAVLPV